MFSPYSLVWLPNSELREMWSGLTEDGRGGRRHTMIAGEAQFGDEVLFKMKCERKEVFIGYREEVVRFPTIGVISDKKISSVVCFDEWGDDTGGEAKIINGGIGADYVEIHLRSCFWRGYSFTITIFGK